MIIGTMCMSMLTLNEADNKEILYTFIDIDCRYSLLFYQACSHFNTVYGQLWAILYSVRDACKMIFFGL